MAAAGMAVDQVALTGYWHVRPKQSLERSVTRLRWRGASALRCFAPAMRWMRLRAAAQVRSQVPNHFSTEGRAMNLSDQLLVSF
jgi:hypothetical protein